MAKSAPSAPSSGPVAASLNQKPKISKERTRIFLIIAAFIVLGALTGFFRISIRGGYFEDDKKATALEIDRLHARLDAGQFDAIYENAHRELKKQQNRENLIQAMRDTRARTGKFKAVTYSVINVIVRTPVESRAVYNTTFENGDFTEMFTFAKDNNTYRLAMYTVAPGTVRPTGALAK